MHPPTRKLHTLARSGAIYGFGNGLTKILLFLMVPLYSHTIAPKELSLLAVLDPAEQFAYGLLSLGTLQALFRHHRPDDPVEIQRAAVSTLFWFLAVLVVVTCGVFVLFADSLASVLVGDHPLARTCTLLTIATLGIRLMSVVGVGFLQNTQRAGTLVTMLFLGTLLFCTTNALTLTRGGEIDGVFYARLWLLTPAVLVGLWQSRALLAPRFDPALLKRMLLFSSPLILAAAANPVLNFVDRWMLAKMVDADTTGIYDISYRFGMIPGMLITAPFLRTWHPTMYHASDGADWPTFLRRLLLYFTFVGSVAWLSLSVFTAELLTWFSTPAYFAGHRVIPYVAAAQILYGVGWIAAAGLASHGRTLALGAIVATGAAANVALNVLWIPRYGFMGAAVATLVAFAVIFAGFVLHRRHERPPLPWVRLGAMITVAVLAAAAIARVGSPNVWATILLRVLLLLPAAALLGLLADLTPRRIRWIVRDLRGAGR